MHHHILRLLMLLITACLPPTAKAGLPGGDSLWLAPPPRLPAIDLYFFWSNRCPHCLEARPFLESLPDAHPWIRLHSLEILEHPANRERFAQLTATLGITPQSVPTFMWCGQHHTGYVDDQRTGRLLLASLVECYRQHYGEPPAAIGPESASTSLSLIHI